MDKLPAMVSSNEMRVTTGTIILVDSQFSGTRIKKVPPNLNFSAIMIAKALYCLYEYSSIQNGPFRLLNVN